LNLFVLDFGLDREKLIAFIENRYFSVDQFSVVFLDKGVFCIAPAGKPEPVFLDPEFRIRGDSGLGIMELGPFFDGPEIPE
jgi:hypothetical protein